MSGTEKSLPQDRDQRICENIGLVHACARRFLGRGVEYDDLFQASCMGLLKATDGFEEERGLRFSTYAVPVILGEIRRLFRDGGSVKVSRSLKELSLRASRERDAFAASQGREPTVHELANLLGVEPEQAEEEEGNQIDVPVAPPEEGITDRIALRQVLRELPPQDRALIVQRYLHSRTQQATADLLGMTQVQVSRRERAILARMREKLTG